MGLVAGEGELRLVARAGGSGNGALHYLAESTGAAAGISRNGAPPRSGSGVATSSVDLIVPIQSSGQVERPLRFQALVEAEPIL